MIIKKEKDRKFYNSQTKKYVTLKQIFQYVKKGMDFKVINLNNQDITLETKSSAIIKHASPEHFSIILDNKKSLALQKQYILFKTLALTYKKMGDSFQTDPKSALVVMNLYEELFKQISDDPYLGTTESI